MDSYSQGPAGGVLEISEERRSRGQSPKDERSGGDQLLITSKGWSLTSHSHPGREEGHPCYHRGNAEGLNEIKVSDGA